MLGIIPTCQVVKQDTIPEQVKETRLKDNWFELAS